MEDAHALVRPKLNQLVLALVVIFVREEQALENLRNIPHIVNVMGLLGCGQEILHALVEDVDCGQAECIAQELYIIAELDELRDKDRVVDLAHLLLVGVCEVNQVELGDDSWCDVGTATAWLAHGCKNLELAHEVLDNLGAVIPIARVEPLSEKFNGWLRSIRVLLWHVEIVDEANSFQFSIFRLELVLGSSVEVALDDLLGSIRARSS